MEQPVRSKGNPSSSNTDWDCTSRYPKDNDSRVDNGKPEEHHVGIFLIVEFPNQIESVDVEWTFMVSSTTDGKEIYSVEMSHTFLNGEGGWGDFSFIKSAKANTLTEVTFAAEDICIGNIKFKDDGEESKEVVWRVCWG